MPNFPPLATGGRTNKKHKPQNTLNMKRPQITPGQWQVRQGDIVYSDHKGRFVCDCERTPYEKRPAPPDEQDKANARATAALPALLEALEKTFASLEDAREIILDLDPDAHARTRPLSDQIANARAALRVAGYEF